LIIDYLFKLANFKPSSAYHTKMAGIAQEDFAGVCDQRKDFSVCRPTCCGFLTAFLIFDEPFYALLNSPVSRLAPFGAGDPLKEAPTRTGRQLFK